MIDECGEKRLTKCSWRVPCSAASEVSLDLRTLPVRTSHKEMGSASLFVVRKSGVTKTSTGKVHKYNPHCYQLLLCGTSSSKELSSRQHQEEWIKFELGRFRAVQHPDFPQDQLPRIQTWMRFSTFCTPSRVFDRKDALAASGIDSQWISLWRPHKFLLHWVRFQVPMFWMHNYCIYLRYECVITGISDESDHNIFFFYSKDIS